MHIRGEWPRSPRTRTRILDFDIYSIINKSLIRDYMEATKYSLSGFAMESSGILVKNFDSFNAKDFCAFLTEMFSSANILCCKIFLLPISLNFSCNLLTSSFASNSV